MHLYNNHSPEATEALYALACGPDVEVKKYNTCIVNGIRFHTKDRDSRRKTQNSGLMVEGNHGDNVIDFYGVVTDIFELDYLTQRRVMLFKCEWFDLSSRKSSIHIDGDIISVNVSRTWYENDSYVLACQAKHIFYVNDTKLGKNWRVMQKFQHRHVFDVPEMQNDSMDISNDEVYQDELQEQANVHYVGVQEMDLLLRDDMDPKILDNNIIENNIRTEFVNEEEEDILEEHYSEEEEAEFISDEDMDVGY